MSATDMTEPRFAPWRLRLKAGLIDAFTTGAAEWAAQGVNPLSACVNFAPPLLAQFGPALFGPTHQTLTERVFGIAVVIDD